MYYETQVKECVKKLISISLRHLIINMYTFLFFGIEARVLGVEAEVLGVEASIPPTPVDRTLIVFLIVTIVAMKLRRMKKYVFLYQITNN